jgi:murein DD-endopeptidase MepM/ murein hydrolase activator NlpD
VRVLPWIVGGTAALGAYLWTRRPDATSAGADNEPKAAALPDAQPTLPGAWVWPVGVWQGRRPEISDGFAGQRRGAKGELIPHGGVDLMYRRRAADPWRAGTPNGSPGWVMPERRPALAASDGVIWYADQTPRGYAVIVDHAPRQLATYYTHLSALRVAPKQRVVAGQPLGVIGADPLDAAHLLHLHFEIWRGKASTRFDPAPFMRAWAYVPDPGDDSSPALVADRTQRRDAA